MDYIYIRYGPLQADLRCPTSAREWGEMRDSEALFCHINNNIYSPGAKRTSWAAVWHKQTDAFARRGVRETFLLTI